jgi:hypothetical protein
MYRITFNNLANMLRDQKVIYYSGTCSFRVQKTIDGIAGAFINILIIFMLGTM